MTPTQLQSTITSLAAITDANTEFLAATGKQVAYLAKFLGELAETQHKYNEHVASMVGGIILILAEKGIATQEEVMTARVKAVGILDQAAAAAETK